MTPTIGEFVFLIDDPDAELSLDGCLGIVRSLDGPPGYPIMVRILPGESALGRLPEEVREPTPHERAALDAFPPNSKPNFRRLEQALGRRLEQKDA